MATAYEKVQLARGKGRPSGLSFIQNIFPDFIELHGDRRFADDPAVIGGIGVIPGAMIGGFIIGIAEALIKGYISSALSDAIVFGLLIVVLLVKPTGFLGRKVQEKV